jgi:uncharacterized membrane protein YhhN
MLELITAHTPSLELVHYLAKPAIVVSLIYLVIHQQSVLKTSHRLLLVAALGFSVSGDILLMFVSRSEWYFITGLLSFLLAHISYLILFFRQRHPKTKPYIPILFLYIYSLVFGYYITDSLGEMLIPVIAYEIVILLMASASFLRKHAVSSFSYKMVVFGALSFLISDSILAINKFYIDVPLSGIWIMITYALAQYLIVIGILKSESVTS